MRPEFSRPEYKVVAEIEARGADRPDLPAITENRFPDERRATFVWRVTAPGAGPLCHRKTAPPSHPTGRAQGYAPYTNMPEAMALFAQYETPT